MINFIFWRNLIFFFICYWTITSPRICPVQCKIMLDCSVIDYQFDKLGLYIFFSFGLWKMVKSQWRLATVEFASGCSISNWTRWFHTRRKIVHGHYYMLKLREDTLCDCINRPYTSMKDTHRVTTLEISKIIKVLFPFVDMLYHLWTVSRIGFCDVEISFMAHQLLQAHPLQQVHKNYTCNVNWIHAHTFCARLSNNFEPADEPGCC